MYYVTYKKRDLARDLKSIILHAKIIIDKKNGGDLGHFNAGSLYNNCFFLESNNTMLKI